MKYLILGAVQGLLEWLPISSEGLVSLLSQGFGPEESPIGTALFLHLGTLGATLVYFRRRWKEVLELKNKPLLFFLLVSTPPSLLLGFLLYRFASGVRGEYLLLLTGSGLLLTSYFHARKTKIRLEGWRLALITGLLQGLSVIPGLSRSGSTVFGLSLSEMKPEKALRFSYMMSAPVILCSSAYLLWKNPALSVKAWPALLTSFLVGILSLKTLFRLAKKVDFARLAFIFSLLCFFGFGLLKAL